MTLSRCETKLCMLAYPKGCQWSLISTEEETEQRGARHWWSISIRPQEGLYLLLRIASTGQLALAIRTEKAPIADDDTTFLYYAKYEDRVYKVIHSLWQKRWDAMVNAMHIGMYSALLREWATILDSYDKTDFHTKSHASYIRRKEQEGEERKNRVKRI